MTKIKETIRWVLNEKFNKRIRTTRFGQPGKPEEASTTEQAPVQGPQALRQNNKVGSLEHGTDDVFVEGTMNGETCYALDTKTIRMIVKLGVFTGKLAPTKTSQRTATGESATVYGKLNLSFGLGEKRFKHEALVAKIANSGILGMNGMSKHDFELDLK